MTVQEAKESIEYLKMQLTEDLEMICFTGDELKALDMSIQALEELEQYRAIGLRPEQIEVMQGHNIALINDLEKYQSLGTVEELKEAREKQVAKKVIFSDDGDALLCPNCDFDLMGYSVDEENPCYCPKCGQALKWGEEDD